MRTRLAALFLTVGTIAVAWASGDASSPQSPPLGLPPVPQSQVNPQTSEKIALGQKLFEDKRFSTTGEVSCATCHDAAKAFTDSPLPVSEGIHKFTGTRNAPTVVNSVYMRSMFWDGRSPDLEDQALHPFVNPIEMGLEDHEPILRIVRSDPQYTGAFEKVFGARGEAITMTQVTQAIAAFERTQISGDSAFDRWFYAGDKSALNDSEKRGYELFIGQARCVSCHRIEQTQALFTDNRFHNIGVGINQIQADVPKLAQAYLKAEYTASEVDKKVLGDKKTSELGRFAVTRTFDDLGSFKTPTLRNVAATAPYMHDGSVKTLRDVVLHYNNGGVTDINDPVNDFLSGGIRPLDLSEEEVDDLVAFMEALTSPEFAELAAATSKK